VELRLHRDTWPSSNFSIAHRVAVLISVSEQWNSLVITRCQEFLPARRRRRRSPRKPTADSCAAKEMAGDPTRVKMIAATFSIFFDSIEFRSANFFPATHFVWRKEVKKGPAIYPCPKYEQPEFMRNKISQQNPANPAEQCIVWRAKEETKKAEINMAQNVSTLSDSWTISCNSLIVGDGAYIGTSGIANLQGTCRRRNLPPPSTNARICSVTLNWSESIASHSTPLASRNTFTASPFLSAKPQAEKRSRPFRIVGVDDLFQASCAGSLRSSRGKTPTQELARGNSSKTNAAPCRMALGVLLSGDPRAGTNRRTRRAIIRL